MDFKYCRAPGPNTLNGREARFNLHQETFLDKVVEHIMLKGYALIAQRDRNDERQGGGIAAFAASAIAEHVASIQSSADAERSWFMLHADQGPHLVGVWYRPPAPSETATVTTCKAEYAALEGLSLGSIILGDLNVHHKHWLIHSSHNNIEGTELQIACDDIGLQQEVAKRTAGSSPHQCLCRPNKHLIINIWSQSRSR